MWTGSPDDFRKLLRHIEARFEEFIDGHVDKATSYERTIVSRAEWSVTRVKARIESYPDQASEMQPQLIGAQEELQRSLARLDEAKDKARQAARLDLTIWQKNSTERTITGTADEIAEYLEDAEYLSLRVSAPSGTLMGYAISFRADSESGVSLNVRADSDPNWASAVFSDLSEKVSRSVPKLRWLRNRLTLYIAWIIALAFSLYFIFDAIGDFINQTRDRTIDTIVVTLYLMSVPILSAVAVNFTRRLIPSFEIVKNGKKSVSTRIGASAGAFISAIPLGLIGEVVVRALLPTE